MAKKEDSILGGILKYSISTWANLIIGFLSVTFLCGDVRTNKC